MRHCHPAVIAAAMLTATAMLAHALHAAPMTVSHANTPDTAPGGTVTITDMNTGTVTESNVTIVHTAKGLERLLDAVLAAPTVADITPIPAPAPANHIHPATIGDRFTLPERTGLWQFIGETPKGLRFNQVSKDGTRLLAGKTCSLTPEQYASAMLVSWNHADAA